MYTKTLESAFIFRLLFQKFSNHEIKCANAFLMLESCEKVG